MKVGLFFGSFNPIHIGHLIIANYVLNNSKLERIWLVVSPQNPLKEKKTLLNQYHRLHLVKLAIEGNNKFKASDIEFKLPQPSYTINTLTYLKEKFPQHQFSLIMGSDNIATIDKWKNHESILADYPIYVYQREQNISSKFHRHKNVIVIDDVPLLNISSSKVRQMIENKISTQYILPEAVNDYILANKYYR
jgi:nicotinate-nucleotide adenylyltransferase